MKNRFLLTGAGLAVVLAGFGLGRWTPVEADPAVLQYTQEAKIEAGRYLTFEVAMCIDCHSPRDAEGRFIESLHLTGSILPFEPSVPMPWVGAAPALAGLPDGYTAESMIHYLMTGERPNGMSPALPPMPAFRLNRSDAEAMTAFLLSLGTDESLE